MKSLLPALALAAALVGVGGALSLIPMLTERAAHADDHAAAPRPAPARSGHGHGGAHPWSGGQGAIPDLTQATLELERRGNIVIRSDRDFTPAAGVRSGNGSFEDPFVISGWFVDSILVADTTKAFEIKGNYVSNILILDWTGKGGYVHHNHVENLRTNRNVARTGDASATVIENNLILRVQELRHFDGEVRNNTIGKEGLLGTLQTDVVLNIAGLNGAGIHDNVVWGGVDMKIHGHHHSDRPGLHSHNHGQADEEQGEGSNAPAGASSRQQADDHVEDHQVRYVDFLFYRNVIHDDGFGLRYNDLNHAGDDREATSEQEPDLEKPHVHHTTVRLLDNVVDGATLRVAVLNSADERHLPGESALLEIAGNRILRPAAGDGIVLQSVRDATVLIHDNVVEKGGLQLTGKSAILLKDFSNSTVVVGGNQLGPYAYGVRATLFDDATRWTVLPNDAPGVKQEVYWDSSVANPPEGSDEAAAAHDHEHEHEHAAATAARLRLLG